MSKTKKLTAGVPIVDSSGAVTPVSIAELARQVGEKLGVQKAAYEVGTEGWIRLARIDSSAGILTITHTYNNTQTAAVVIAFSGGYGSGSFFDAKILSGTPRIFNKLRFVSKLAEGYLEVYSHQSKLNKWLLHVSNVDCEITGGRLVLYKSRTLGEIAEGFGVKELTLADLQMGGV